MAEQSRPLVVAPTLGGVFNADATRPPVPPQAARAVEIRNDTGRVICFAWVAPEHAGEILTDAWNWSDAHSAPASVPTTTLVSSFLRLTP